MKRLLLPLLLVALLALPMLATAQDSTEEATPPAVPTETPGEVIPPGEPEDLFPDTPDVNEAGESLLLLIQELVLYASSLPVTVALVSLLKRIKALDPIPATYLNLVIAGFITALIWASRSFGFEPELFKALGFIGSALALVLNVLTTTGGSALTYKLSKYVQMPILGYQRPGNVKPS